MSFIFCTFFLFLSPFSRSSRTSLLKATAWTGFNDSITQRASLSSYRKLSCVKYGLLMWLARTLLRLKVYEIDLH